MNNFFDIPFQNGNIDAIRLLLILGFGGALLYGLVNYLIKSRATSPVNKSKRIFKDLIIKHLVHNPSIYKYEWQPVDIPLEEFREFNLGRKSIRSALVQAILEIFASAPDHQRQSLRKLYRDLDLELYTIMELQTLKGNNLGLAIKELAEMCIYVEKRRMRGFLKHRSPMIRNATKTYFKKIYFAKEVIYAAE